MTAPKNQKGTRLDRELERAAIMLLKDAFRGNNRSRSASSNTTHPDGNGAQTTPDPGPTLTERAKVFEAVSRFRQIQARIADDDDDTGTGSLDDLRSRLHDPKVGSGAAGSPPASRANGGHA